MKILFMFFVFCWVKIKWISGIWVIVMVGFLSQFAIFGKQSLFFILFFLLYLCVCVLCLYILICILCYLYGFTLQLNSLKRAFFPQIENCCTIPRAKIFTDIFFYFKWKENDEILICLGVRGPGNKNDGISMVTKHVIGLLEPHPHEY